MTRDPESKVEVVRFAEMTWSELGKRAVTLVLLVGFVTLLLWLNASNFDITELRVIVGVTIGCGAWILGVPVLKIFKVWK